MAHVNTPVPEFSQFFPLNEPAIGVPVDVVSQESESTVPKLFQPITLKDTTFKNRIFVSPMCQYSAHDGHVTDWHLVHYGGFATRGVSAILAEAAAVVPEGRISPEDAGIWSDSHVDAWKRVVDFSHGQGTKIGLQLAHAGRKASCHAPWVQSRAPKGTAYVATLEEQGWPDNVRGPSAIPFSDSYPKPKPLSVDEIEGLSKAFVDATDRAEKAGFDFLEIHSAHGYLFHQFLSPLSNDRTDDYGGSFENRIRFLLCIVKTVREAWPSKPLFVRVSASDWIEGPERGDNGEWNYWGPEQTALLAQELLGLGVDLVDVSSGGASINQKITIEPGYQIPFAAKVKSAVPALAVGAVGLITGPEQAESYLQEGKADVIFLARELLRNPHWPLYAAKALGVPVKAANQYERAW
ncbi:NADH:flavin oxidoreductase/NADH oxidase [Coprinopsis sp. MPI-PUGE-AT-0042]|nr:NADH:flavin oxidoreductase/NADH oxidase [Coprinopsis sp. MPI-PUGE-AT-0042]